MDFPAPSKLTCDPPNGKQFTLNLAEGFAINVAAEGLKRVRFMAESPDKRIFVTDMYSLADNRKGAVYILDAFNLRTRRFSRVVSYLRWDSSSLSPLASRQWSQ